MKRRRASQNGAMLDLWRQPRGAGEPVGCLATTYTFTPGLFDEQCLARFLDIESDPDREDLAYLLERESLLGSVYAGVIVDHTQAGVEHSLRWDVLAARIPGGKQHAKLSVLAWTQHVRVIVASANLTDQGYRTNHEAVSSVDLTPTAGNKDLLADALEFLRHLLAFVPGSTEGSPATERGAAFLSQVEELTGDWAVGPKRGRVRQKLACTAPSSAVGHPRRSSMEECVAACRARGGSPKQAWIASPFFDMDGEPSEVTARLCKSMARGGERELWFCLPSAGAPDGATTPRLAAPRSLIETAYRYSEAVHVELLPDHDTDRNARIWHAKMLGLFSQRYAALMVGSSNFTCAGMGIGMHPNAEANLLTIADCTAYKREAGQLREVWPDMEEVEDPEGAEWLGTRTDADEESEAAKPPLPAGFRNATYRAGETREIVMWLDAERLPAEWCISASGGGDGQLVAREEWEAAGRPASLAIAWEPVQPPQKLVVEWDAEHEGFLALNVDDSGALPPPTRLESMTADDMLGILAASDPSAAFRVWAKRQEQQDERDDDLDTADPPDLDPLRRYDLHATYLHRIRQRARVLARLRANLERPVWSRQALEWRLRGLIGVEPLADRMARDFADADGRAEEALLMLADLLIVLYEVDYPGGDGAMGRDAFQQVYRPFLRGLAERLDDQTRPHRHRITEPLLEFWDRVLERCRR